MSSKQIAIVIALIVVVIAGILLFRKSDTKETTMDNPTPSPSQNTTPPPAASNCARNFDQEKLKTAKVDSAGKLVVMDVEGFGSIKIELYEKDAPKTVENFLRLVNAGFYDCLTFHRVSRGFVIQGGDPSGNGTGGQSAFGADFADELDATTPSYKAGYVKGVLAMANRGANTNSSQFFIMIGDVPLPHAYTIFGKVTEGQEVADKIGMVDIIPNLQMNPQGTDGAPRNPVVISKAIIINK